MKTTASSEIYSFVYFAVDILSDYMSTLTDEQNHLVYSFFNANQICDFLTAESSLLIGHSPQLREHVGSHTRRHDGPRNYPDALLVVSRAA